MSVRCQVMRRRLPAAPDVRSCLQARSFLFLPALVCLDELGQCSCSHAALFDQCEISQTEHQKGAVAKTRQVPPGQGPCSCCSAACQLRQQQLPGIWQYITRLLSMPSHARQCTSPLRWVPNQAAAADGAGARACRTGSGAERCQVAHGGCQGRWQGVRGWRGGEERSRGVAWRAGRRGWQLPGCPGCAGTCSPATPEAADHTAAVRSRP